VDERPKHRGTAAIGLVLAVGALAGVIWVSAGPRRGTHVTLYTSGSSSLHVSGAVRGDWTMPVVALSLSRAERDGRRGLNARWIGAAACPTCELVVVGQYDPGTGMFNTESVQIHIPERPYVFWARQDECAVTVERVDDTAAQGELSCIHVPTLVEGSRLAIDATGQFDLGGAQQQ
jgi:hypothetical protein